MRSSEWSPSAFGWTSVSFTFDLCFPPGHRNCASRGRTSGSHSTFPCRIRMSGIKGLQGVVRKTVNDELQANIWDPQHMDKIVPSLLFNLQHVEEAER